MMEQIIICGVDGTLKEKWDVILVALSCIVAIAGSFAAFDCADRMRSAGDPKSRRRYFLAGASLMGVAVWTMHFVGMLAHQLGIPVQYDPSLSMISMLAAALGAGLAFLIVNRTTVTWFHIATGGVAMGLAIASMHYLGMASMRIPATIRYDPWLFAASILLAIIASAGALALAHRSLMKGRIHYWEKSVSAAVMGFAIAGMHYVGMAAARYMPTGTTLSGEGALVGPWSLQSLIIAAGLVILGALLAMTSKNSAERQLALETLEVKSNEAIAALRAKDMFLASLSHELRTPLNPALLQATESSTNPDFPPAAREAFAMIARHIVLQTRLIDDLLDVTRISRGAMKIEPRDVLVHTILHETIRIVRPEIVAKRLKLVVELKAVETATSADPDRLQQVFWNLLQNAAKYSSPGGIIRVSTYNDGASIAVAVSDTGIGMTQAEIARCFERFEQGEHNLGGLGLGLSISRSIIELHGGSISASSAGPGYGTTFTVALKSIPAQAKRSEEKHAVSSQATSTRGLAVLLVEDHEASRLALQRLLQRRGHNVVAVSTVATALEEGAARKFDMLISDIGLPDGDGYELMTKLSEKYSFIAIAVTGYGTEEDVQRAMDAGFLTHVMKPITVHKLDEALAFAADRQLTSRA
jgi:diguanylate cyclase